MRKCINDMNFWVYAVKFLNQKIYFSPAYHHHNVLCNTPHSTSSGVTAWIFFLQIFLSFNLSKPKIKPEIHCDICFYEEYKEIKTSRDMWKFTGMRPENVSLFYWNPLWPWNCQHWSCVEGKLREEALVKDGYSCALLLPPRQNKRGKNHNLMLSDATLNALLLCRSRCSPIIFPWRLQDKSGLLPCTHK